MFVQMRKAIVTEGSSEKMVERFKKKTTVRKQEGFVDLSVMVKKSRKDEEEVIIMIRWESEELWKKWETSEAHLVGHRERKNHLKPDYILRSENAYYHVEALNEKLDEEKETTPAFLHSRDVQKDDTIIDVQGTQVGGEKPSMIAGPCAVESYEQISQVADEMKGHGLHLLRGGAFKPRTSPYDFQGLGMEGLMQMSKAAKELGLSVVTEIMSTDRLEEALPFVDVIQIGSRNMHNFDLLKAVGRTNKPVLLKRGLAATIKEFKLAAEYILAEGNSKVILCERGIRTYENATRNTLDISAVPILKQETHLPVIVDVSHSTGRKELLTAASKAALAAGADGVMTEVHPDPKNAWSDAAQQMDFHEFRTFMDEWNSYVERHTRELSYQ